MKFTHLAVFDDKHVSVYFLQHNLVQPKNNDIQEEMKRSKGVYVTKHKIRDEQNLVYHLYRSERGRRQENNNNKSNFASQFDSNKDNCTCKSINKKHNEYRYFGGIPKQIYACHGSSGYIDIGVGSVKTIQRRKVKRIYLPETDDTGVGSSDLSSYILRKRYPKILTVSSFYGNKKTSSKCVGGILEYNRGCVIHQKLSPIVHTKSGATSPKMSLIIRKDTKIGSNTIDHKTETIGTQFEAIETETKEGAKQENKEFKASVAINQPKVAAIKPPVKVSEQTQKNKFSKELLEDKKKTGAEKEAKDCRTYSSDSLVQHVHNLEIPSDEKSSRTSFPDPMENKLEREYRKMFSTSKSKESKPSSENPIPEFKSGSILKRRFEALRRGIIRKDESNSKKKDSEVIKATQNEDPTRKDVSVTSDPPSLVSRSFSNTEKYKAAIQEKKCGKTKTSSHKKDKRSSDTKQSNQNSVDENGVKGMFRLWGKKFNFEEDTYGKRQATPMPSYDKSKKSEDVSQEKEQPKIETKENKKESRKFFFFKKKSKDKNKDACIAKKDVTAGRCEIKDGIVLKVADATTPKVKSKTSHEDNKGNITRKTWLKRFMSETIESARSVNIRWNNSLYATSSSTVFELLDSVYRNTNVVFSQSEVTTGESSYYKSFTKQVNFVQDIEAWMIPKTIMDRPMKLVDRPLREIPLRQIPLHINSEKVITDKNMEFTVSDQKWYIEKSEALSHKIEVVLHSNNIPDLGNKKTSSQYLKIDIPGDFFDSSSDESKKTHSSEEEVYSEKVYNIVEYETNSEIRRGKKPIIDIHKGNFHEPKDIKMIVSVKNSKSLESKILETVIKRPTGNKDVVVQDNDENEGQRCDVISVGIITQRDLREIKKSILKTRVEVSDDDSEPAQTMNRKKCEFAESYLQEYYRHWTPFGVDLYPWCASDTHFRSSSEKSLTSLQNFTDCSKSCPNIYEDLESTIITPCETSAPCKQVTYDQLSKELIKKVKNKFKRHTKAKTEVEIINNQRILPKDSLAVFKRRKVNETTCRSQWASYCSDVKDVTVSVPSVQNKCCCSSVDRDAEVSSGGKSTDTVKCGKNSDRTSCACQSKNSLDEEPGTLSNKSSDASLYKNKLKKKKHAVINPKPPCEIPPSTCKKLCEVMEKPFRDKTNGASDKVKPTIPDDICELLPRSVPAQPSANPPVSLTSVPVCRSMVSSSANIPGKTSKIPSPCKSPLHPETSRAPPPSLATALPKPTPPIKSPPNICTSSSCKKPPSCSDCKDSALSTCPTAPVSKKPEKQKKFQLRKRAQPKLSPTPSASKKPQQCIKSEIGNENSEPVSSCPPFHSSTPFGDSTSSICPNPRKKTELCYNSSRSSPLHSLPSALPPASPISSEIPCCESSLSKSLRKPNPSHKKSSIPLKKSSANCCKISSPQIGKSAFPSCSKCSPISAILSWKKSSTCKSPPRSPQPHHQMISPAASLLSWTQNSECFKIRSPPPRNSGQCYEEPFNDCKNCCQSPTSSTSSGSAGKESPKESPCASPTNSQSPCNSQKSQSPCDSPKSQSSFDLPEPCPQYKLPRLPEHTTQSPELPELVPNPADSPKNAPSLRTGISLTMLPCPSKSPAPPKPKTPKKKQCSAPPCDTVKNLKTNKNESSPTKNRLSNLLIGTCPLPEAENISKCSANCSMKNPGSHPLPEKVIIPPTNDSGFSKPDNFDLPKQGNFGVLKPDDSCFPQPDEPCSSKPDDYCFSKPTCEQEPSSPSQLAHNLPEALCPPELSSSNDRPTEIGPATHTYMHSRSKSKLSGILLQMKPVKKTCADDCPSWQETKQMINVDSKEHVNIRIKKATPSTEEIREPINLKIQDEDGRTLFERKDYTCENQHEVVIGGIYKDSKTNRASSLTVVNMVEKEDEKDLTSYKSDKSLVKSLEINFKLHIRQGDKTTEINVGNDCDDKQNKTNDVRKTSHGVFMLNSEGHEVVKEIPKNDINIKITLRNFKSKTKNKVNRDKKHCDDFSKKITDQFQTVSTGYSDVEEENVFSVHRATINLASSNDVSHVCNKIQNELVKPNCVDSSYSTVEVADVRKDEYMKNICSKKDVNNETIKKELSEVNESVQPTFNESGLEENSTLTELNKSEINNDSVMSKVASREQKKSLLKKVFQKSGKRSKNKENIRELRDMLKIILTDSSDNEDTNVSSSELAKDVTYTSLKPNFFRDSESMNNYYNMNSDGSANENNIDALYPTEDNSGISNSSDSEDKKVTFRGCMCSKVAEKLNQSNVNKIGCCCRQSCKKDEETNCDIRNAADYFLLNYKTTEYVDVETQNSRKLTSKVNSFNISIHSSSKRKSFSKSEDLKVLEEVTMINRSDQKTRTIQREGFQSVVKAVELVEQIKTMKSPICNGASKNISRRRTIAKESETADICERNVTENHEDLVSEKVTELDTDQSKSETTRSKKSEKSSEEDTDILQSYAAKKAVLEIYAEKTKQGDNFVVKLPKFTVEKESEIVKNFEQIASSYKSVCKENVFTMSIKR